jgi:hypothetical protein
VTWPLTSVFETTVNCVLLAPFWLPVSLKIRLACVVEGKVKRAMPLRVVVVSSVVTWLLSVTLYEPADADSLACEKASVAELLTVPTVGSTGTSPAAPQPGPAMWVRLKPVIEESLYW